jgi:hypothetical protein
MREDGREVFARKKERGIERGRKRHTHRGIVRER